jgi:hypothetical protein
MDVTRCRNEGFEDLLTELEELHPLNNQKGYH